MGRLDLALPGPFRLASLNKERQARPARRTALELEKAGAGAKVVATGATVDTHFHIIDRKVQGVPNGRFGASFIDIPYLRK